MSGFIKLSRKFFKNILWNEPREYNRAEAFLDLIQMAKFEAEKIMLNGRVIEVQKGEIVASCRFLAQRWKWGKTKVVNYLKMLELEKMITIRQDTRQTILKLCNYDTYNTPQDSTQDSGETATRQRQDSGETNIRTIRTIRTKDSNTGVSFTPPSLDELKIYISTRNVKIDAQGFLDFYESKGWMIGKNKMKDWKAAVRTWERNEKGTSNQQSEEPIKERNYDESIQ